MGLYLATCSKLGNAFMCGNATRGKLPEGICSSWAEKGWESEKRFGLNPATPAVQLECGGCCWCPLGAPRFPGSADQASLDSSCIWEFVCQSCSTRCSAAVARLQLCACNRNVSCWRTKQTACSGVMPWPCGESQHCWGSVLRECVFFYFPFPLVFLVRWRFPPVSWCALHDNPSVCRWRSAARRPTSHAVFVTVVEAGIDFVYSLGLRIVTAVPRTPGFFLLSLKWLKQPNMHSFLENWEMLWKK